MHLAPQGFCPALQLKQGCCKQDQPGTALTDTGTCIRARCMLNQINGNSMYWSWTQKLCACYSNCHFIWHIFCSGHRHPSQWDALKKRRQLFSITLEWNLSFTEIHCSQLISGSSTNRQRAFPLFLDFLHMLARLSRETCWENKETLCFKQVRPLIWNYSLLLRFPSRSCQADRYLSSGSRTQFTVNKKADFQEQLALGKG